MKACWRRRWNTISGLVSDLIQNLKLTSSGPYPLFKVAFSGWSPANNEWVLVRSGDWFRRGTAFSCNFVAALTCGCKKEKWKYALLTKRMSLAVTVLLLSLMFQDMSAERKTTARKTNKLYYSVTFCQQFYGNENFRDVFVSKSSSVPCLHIIAPQAMTYVGRAAMLHLVHWRTQLSHVELYRTMPL